MRRDLTTCSIILDTREKLQIGPVVVEFPFIQVGFLSSVEMTGSLRVG